MRRFGLADLRFCQEALPVVILFYRHTVAMYGNKVVVCYGNFKVKSGLNKSSYKRN